MLQNVLQTELCNRTLQAGVVTLERIDILSKSVEPDYSLAAVAMPQPPLDPIEAAFQCGGFVWLVMGETLDELPEGGEPHGDAKPVDVVLGTRRHVADHPPKTVGAISEKGNLLVHLDALIVENFEKAPLRFVIVSLHKTELSMLTVSWYGFANKDFEIVLPVIPVAHMAAIDADNSRSFWNRAAQPIRPGNPQ